VLLLLSDVEGVLDATGSLISTAAPHELAAIPVRAGGSGRGGMASKLAAAQLAALNGVPAIIARAGDPSVIGRTIGGQPVGTRVEAAGPAPGPQWSWLAGAAPGTSALIINREAEESIRSGTSLFGSGIKRVKGEFERGDVVRLLTPAGQLVGRGVVNTGSVLLNSLRALRKDEVNTLLLTCLAAEGDLPVETPPPAGPVRPQLEQALRTVTSHSPQIRYRITQDILHLLARPALKALVTHMTTGSPTPTTLDKLPTISIIDRNQLYVFS
jgi:glutamate 5-kinase